eukprot:4141045-Ditylum_brightwellii.AAC.1
MATYAANECFKYTKRELDLKEKSSAGLALWWWQRSLVAIRLQMFSPSGHCVLDTFNWPIIIPSIMDCVVASWK